MNYLELIDPELKKNARTVPFNRFVTAAGNIYQEAAWRLTKCPQDIKEEVILTEGYQGLPLKTSIFSPADAEDKMPALVYAHGGAFAYKPSAYHKQLACIYAKKAGCKVFFVHYHLSPRYHYPAAYEDVLSLYRYVTEHAEELGVDADRIGIGGDSAGASLAALVCSRYEEENVKMPLFQMLVYPFTDGNMETDSMKQFTDTPLWNSQYMENMWTYYCGEDRALRSQAAPMHCPLPDVIPDTYIETAQYDCLHDEGILYGEKLKKAGAEVMINDTTGTYHGYDIVTDAQIVKDNVKKRLSFLQRKFNL